MVSSLTVLLFVTLVLAIISLAVSIKMSNKNNKLQDDLKVQMGYVVSANTFRDKYLDSIRKAQIMLTDSKTTKQEVLDYLNKIV